MSHLCMVNTETQVTAECPVCRNDARGYTTSRVSSPMPLVSCDGFPFRFPLGGRWDLGEGQDTEEPEGT